MDYSKPKIEKLPQERREMMLEELRLKGRLVAADLSQEYHVSLDTVRRDLGDLAAQGLLKRVHGGALPLAPHSQPYAERAKEDASLKLGLAHAARELVRDGQVILFGGGTTNAEIARQLPAELCATVVTASPLTALALAGYDRIEVILVGGKLNRSELVCTDAEAVEKVRRVQADLCFLGVCSLHAEVGISANYHEEVMIMRAMIEQSAEVVAVVTADKLGTIAPFVVAPIESLTHILTDSSASEEVLAPYRSLGIEILLAD